MISRLVIRPEAEADLAEAVAWYQQRREGLGLELLDEVKRAIEAIKENPGAFPVVHDQARRVLTRRFPYAVYYIVENDAATVLAILHAKRDPKHWQKRV